MLTIRVLSGSPRSTGGAGERIALRGSSRWFEEPRQPDVDPGREPASTTEKGVGDAAHPHTHPRGGKGGYFFPIVTEAVPAGETQPAAEISVTDRVADPLSPTLNLTPLVP